MKVILTSNAIIDGKFYKAGKELDLSETDAEALIDGGLADAKATISEEWTDAKALIDGWLAYGDAPKVEEVKAVAPKATSKKAAKGAK